MMKKKYAFLFFGLLALLTSDVWAQQSTSYFANEFGFNSQPANGSGFINNIRNASFYTQGMIAQKPTQTQSRMTGVVLSKYNGTDFISTDSTRFIWNGQNNASLALDKYYTNAFFENLLPHTDFYSPKEEIESVLATDTIKEFKWMKGPSIYRPSSTTITLFDSAGRVNTQIFYELVDSVFALKTKKTYEYNGLGHVIFWYIQNWTGNSWLNSERYIFEYDNGNLETTIQSNWDDLGSAWENAHKQYFTYNANNLITESIYQSWDNVGKLWDNNTKTTYAYDANSNRILEQKTVWNNINSEWKNTFKTDYSYTIHNKRSTVLYWHWDGGSWDVTNKDLYTYDNSGEKITSITPQTWDGRDWNYDEKFEYRYTGNNITQIGVFNWINPAIRFREETRFHLSLNKHNQYTEIYHQDWDSIVWRTFTDAHKISFFYEEVDNQSSINNQLPEDAFGIYPNPAKDIVTLKLKESANYQIRIIDLSGKVVFDTNENIRSTELKIPVSNLANGVYYLQVRSGVLSGTKGFVIQR